jgi:hypothetical protein
MFRGGRPEDMLFANMTRDQVFRHLSPRADEPIYEDTVLEILRYLGVTPALSQLQSMDDVVDALHTALAQLQQSVDVQVS